MVNKITYSDKYKEFELKKQETSLFVYEFHLKSISNFESK